MAFTLAVVLAFLGNLAAFAAGWYTGWVALPVLATLTYFAYTPLHEAVHGNIHGDNLRWKWLNDFCGYLSAPLIAVPFTSHRYEHLTHHRHTNQPDKDPDFMVSDMGKGVLQSLITVERFIWLQNRYFVTHRWKQASFAERRNYVLEVLVSVGWRVAFVLAVSQPGTIAVIVLGYLLGGFFTAYWFAYRPHIPYSDTRRYRNTSSLIMPTWLRSMEWFWLGQNLHSIHHLFPRVPFYRYGRLHREIEPALRAHGTPIIGVFSRKAVTTTGR